MIFLSIIIPCYNEQRRLDKNLKIKLDYLKKQKYSWELILVNDGSTDKTQKIIKNFININKKYHIKSICIKPNNGKGNAVKEGMLNASGDFRLFTDLDNSTPLSELEKLLNYKNNFDVIIASRYLKESKITEKQSFIRRVISRGGNLYIKLLLGLNFQDTQCGFKLFSKSSVQNIFPKCLIKRWGFDLEVLSLAQKYNYKIKEVPIFWSDAGDSKLRPVKAALQVFSEAIKIKINLITNKYKLN